MYVSAGAPSSRRVLAAWRLAIIAAVAALLIAAGPSTLIASTILFHTDAQLIARSARVVHGRVVAQRAVFAGATGSTIYTVTTIQVIEDLTAMPGDVVEVWELGGVVGAERLKVGGAVSFEYGQEVVVCLEQGPLGYRSVAMGFSKFDVLRGATAPTMRRQVGDALVVGGAVVAERNFEEFRALVAQVTGRPPRRADPAAAQFVAAQPYASIGNPPVRWREADQRIPIKYYRNISAPAPVVSGDAVAEINIALAAWTDPVGSIILQYGGTTFESDARGGWSNTPSAASAVISFEDPNDEIAGAVLALGGGSVSGSGGTVGGTAYDGIVSGFVIFQNAADLPPNFRQPQDFTRILIHEVGHTIGFDHTPLDVTEASKNIMFWSCCSADTPIPPALGADDLLGLRTVYPAPAASGPTMTLDRSTMRFGVVTQGASFVAAASPQTVALRQSGAGTVTWTATATRPWLQVTPASGTGPATLTVSVRPGGVLPSPGAADGAISLAFSGASSVPGPLAVRLSATPNGTSQPPFGVVDTPVQNLQGASGAVPFTGWALDDVEIDRVAICRLAVDGETAPVDGNCGGNSEIFVGMSVFIEGARTDVQALYPSFPKNEIGGWGFLVLTNTLPAQGNGRFTFHVYAHDREQRVTRIGVRSLDADNAHATLPFGTIDTPAQGETIRGSAYVNFGWVLTQQPKYILPNGSTINVYIDGNFIGNVSYNHYRADIATTFPGYANTPSQSGLQPCPSCIGPVGHRTIDTTALSNGLHTIVWTAADTGGRTGGIGSRFFRVANTGSAFTAAATLTAAVDAATTPARNLTPEIRRTLRDMPPTQDGLLARRGWASDATVRAYPVNQAGRAVLRGDELDRFELWLAGGGRQGDAFTGYVQVGDEFTPLPVGSHLNESTGTFVWSPGVGFIGNYDLLFVEWHGDRPIAQRQVRIAIAPKGSRNVGLQIAIDSPKVQQDVAQPFALLGWAADPAAEFGTGVAAVHVWAYPLAGGAPIFLGAATTGQPRADVAASFGERFAGSGFSIPVSGLVPGHYDLAVFAWSTELGDFGPAAVLRMTAR
jgi:hypothetical protein